jgi:hypothetical protein
VKAITEYLKGSAHANTAIHADPITGIVTVCHLINQVGQEFVRVVLAGLLSFGASYIHLIILPVNYNFNMNHQQMSSTYFRT